MNNKKLLSLILCICLSFSLMSGLASANITENDPLITKSYADNTFFNEVLKSSSSSIADSFVFLNYKLEQLKNQSVNNNQIKTLLPNETILLSSGSSVMFISGNADIKKLSGSLIDSTNGEKLSSSSKIALNHTYVVGEGSSAELLVSAPAKVLFKGSVTTSNSSSVSFKDVTETNWFYTDVLYAVSRGLINGRNDEIFDPEVSLTIAEALKLAACMHELYHNGKVTLENDPTIWYASYVNYCVENDIISATYGNYDAFITRDEFVFIFHAALPEEEYKEINSVADNGIPDVKIGDNHSKEIYDFYRAGILIGKNNNNFMPHDEIWRSEVAAIITRMFESSYRQSVTL